MCAHTDRQTHTPTPTAASSTYETHMKHMCTRTSTNKNACVLCICIHKCTQACTGTLPRRSPQPKKHPTQTPIHDQTTTHPRAAPTRSTTRGHPKPPPTDLHKTKCTAQPNNKQHTNKGKTCLQLNMTLLLGK